MSTSRIRPLAPRDHERIAELAREVVETGAEFVYDTVDGVLGYWIGPEVHTFVLEDEGVVAGTYALKANYVDRGSHVANAGYMVARSHRGRGIGRELGEHSIATARALGFRAMQFNMVVATNAALELWRRLGFRTVGTLPGAFRHADEGFVDAHVLFRELEDE